MGKLAILPIGKNIYIIWLKYYILLIYFGKKRKKWHGPIGANWQRKCRKSRQCAHLARWSVKCKKIIRKYSFSRTGMNLKLDLGTNENKYDLCKNTVRYRYLWYDFIYFIFVCISVRWSKGLVVWGSVEIWYDWPASTINIYY